MLRRAVARVRRVVNEVVLALGRVPAALLCVAALSTAVMYCTNDLRNKKDPPGQMGDGAYRPQMARGDGHMHFLVTRSIVFDRDLNFDNDLRFGDPWLQPRTKTGRKNVMQQVGPSLIWAPLLAVAHGASKIANVFGAGVESHGYTMFHQRILFASSVVFAWIAIGLGVLVVRRMIGGRWAAVLAGIAALLGTSLTYYATYMPSYAHAMDAATSAAFFAYWFVTLGETRWRRFIWLGVLLGTAAMVRVQDGAFGIVVAIELVVMMVQKLRAKELAPAGMLAVRGLLVMAIAIVLHVPQFYAWKDMYGEWLTTPQGTGQMRYGHPMVLELLFSARNGWLSTTPLAYFGLIGLVIGAISGPRLGKHVRLTCIALLAAVATQVYINAITYEWWTGASYGNRRMCSVTFAIVVGLAVLLRFASVRLRRLPVRARIGIGVVFIAWFVAWNLSWVYDLRRGGTAGRKDKPTCCRDMRQPMRKIAQPIYDLVGNPFEFPANAWFSIKHGVPIQRWDRAVGSYPLVPGVLGYEDGTYRSASDVWNLADGGGAPYLLDGWGPPQRGEEPVRRLWRWTIAERADFFLPQLMPEPHRVLMNIAANVPAGREVEVVIRWNGDVIARHIVGAEWEMIEFVTGPEIGSNVVTVEAPIAPFQIDPQWRNAPGPPKTPVPVGVAVGPMTVGLPPLTPP